MLRRALSALVVLLVALTVLATFGLSDRSARAASSTKQVYVYDGMPNNTPALLSTSAPLAVAGSSKRVISMTGAGAPLLLAAPGVGAAGGVTATADVAKFSDYAFVTDKAPVFESYEYTAEDSQQLARLYEQQAAQKFTSGDYSLGKLDQYGQRITIQIDLPGQGAAAGRSTILNNGWMIEPDGSIRLLTPFAGFGQ